MPDTITVYTIPGDAYLPAIGCRNGRPEPGCLPAGDYLSHPEMGSRHGRLCLVPCDAPGGLLFYRVDEYQVAPFARIWGPRDHHGPVSGRCFLGMNFTSSQMGLVIKAICAVPTKDNLGDDTEALLATICRQWLNQRERNRARRRHARRDR